MKDIYIPKIGDVIFDNGAPMVVVSIRNYEDYGSCCYCRDYLLCEENYFRSNCNLYTMDDIENHGRWIKVRGDMPYIQKAENIAPYEINSVASFKVRQKVAKTITVYD